MFSQYQAAPVYVAHLINENTLEVEAVAEGSTKEEALSQINWQASGYDANVTVKNPSHWANHGSHILD